MGGLQALEETGYRETLGSDMLTLVFIFHNSVCSFTFHIWAFSGVRTVRKYLKDICSESGKLPTSEW